jgi:hypothetical protein
MVSDTAGAIIIILAHTEIRGLSLSLTLCCPPDMLNKHLPIATVDVANFVVLKKIHENLPAATLAGFAR